MKRLDFIKKIGGATVGLPLLSSFGLPKAYLSVVDQEEREKFDFELYEYIKKKGLINKFYILPNGNIIKGMYMGDKYGYYSEIVLKYPFYSIYREFYPDGYLSKKCFFYSRGVSFGTSFFYDTKGILKKVDEDRKFGKIKIDYIMKFLEEQGLIDLKTGAGWFDSEFHYTSYSLEYNTIHNHKYWIIEKTKGVKFDPNIHRIEKGEPPLYLPFYWYIDGETGQIYTEEEWKAFKQEIKESLRSPLPILTTKSNI